MGMEKRTIKYIDHVIPEEVVRIDLESNTVWQGKEEMYPHIPTVLYLKLYRAYSRFGGFLNAGREEWARVHETEERRRKRREKQEGRLDDRIQYIYVRQLRASHSRVGLSTHLLFCTGAQNW